VTFLYHHRTAGRGAEGLHIASIVRALQARGEDVVVVSPPGVDPLETAGSAPLDKGATAARGVQRLWKLISCHAPQILFEFAEIGYNLYALARLLPALRRKPKAVLYERYAFFLFGGLLAARFLGRRVLLEVNEIAGIQRARKQTLTGFAKWIERQVFSRADAVFVVSSFLQREVIARGARPEAVHVLPNAIDPSRFDAPDSGGPVKAKYHLDGCVVAGFVGWFDEWDRLDLLPEAVRELAESTPELRVLLVGDGPVAGLLRECVKACGVEGRVILTGAVPRAEVPAHIAAMDICVLPDSNPYGSPMALFEMMAMGKAVIAPSLPPIRDVVRDGETALVIRRGNREDLCSALSRLARDSRLREALGGNARRDTLENRTWDRNAQRVIQAACATGRP
jgi:glycosyltransferase involved in cell wall biosynthesis